MTTKLENTAEFESKQRNIDMRNDSYRKILHPPQCEETTLDLESQ